MNYKQFNLALSIKDNNVYLINGVVQGDTANIVNVRLMDGAEPFDFTGYNQVHIEILKPDGTVIEACVTDDEDIDNPNNPYSIQVVDAENGRIAFTLQGQATILSGTHFGQIVIMGAGEKLTSARFNYYSGGSLFEELPEITSSNEYSSLMTLFAALSTIASEEANRAESERQRTQAEFDREVRITELAREISDYLANAEGYVDQTRAYMEAAEMAKELAQNPSEELLGQLLEEFDFATLTAMTEAINNATRDFDAGNYTDDEATVKYLRVKRGFDSELPALQTGELAYSTDTKTVYVGDGENAIPLNGVYVASQIAPDRTDLLWIDLSAGGVVKYHDGSAWQPTSTATFA